MKSELETIYLECNDAYQRANKLQKELDILKKEKEDLIKHRELETGTDLASNLQVRLFRKNILLRFPCSVRPNYAVSFQCWWHSLYCNCFSVRISRAKFIT
ncbi:hypothetical protein EUGRSUZ_A02251 [Eucalyptus grandis]|uniref:Uncharacterized protein n=2 Tax=Eucalyptus grandis TaxID=71139 RepID=A0ACC3M5R6_EUCGR|nr:hypothetical protein EUGRSUZ_A02251 [Eucalyptus grandis]